ncbi:hypothetical protein TWF132_004122 [Orbilia oligospora]|nr:hypothetical protein TWF132_004122 [Orbilia oligospora]
MVLIGRVELGPHYHPQNNPGDVAIEEIPPTSLDYEPVVTAWRTALAITRSRKFRRALCHLADKIQSGKPLNIIDVQVDEFILDLKNDYQQSLHKYMIILDGRLQRSVLRTNERPTFGIHLNKHYVRSLLLTTGNEESRLRCLLATAIVHEFAHCFVTFIGYQRGQVTPERVNHNSFSQSANGQGEAGRYLEGKLWGGTLEWENPDPGSMIGDLYVLDKDSNARLVRRTQVLDIGSYRMFGMPYEILSASGLYLELAPNDITFPGSVGFRGLRSFERSPNPLPAELLHGRLMAARVSSSVDSELQSEEEVEENVPKGG